MKSLNYNKFLSVATLFLLLVNMVILYLLWSHKKPRHDMDNIPPPGPVFEFVNRELKLTTQQQDEYKKLREMHQANQKPLLDSIHAAKDAFFELLKQPGITDSTLNIYSNKLISLQQELEIITFKHFQQLRVICTPEQQIKFDQIIHEVLHQMAGPKRGKGGQPPPPDRNESDRDHRLTKEPDPEGVRPGAPPPPDNNDY